MDRQTNTHTTKHLILERSIKAPNASERKVGENIGQEALRRVGQGPPRGRNHPGHRQPRAELTKGRHQHTVGQELFRSPFFPEDTLHRGWGCCGGDDLDLIPGALRQVRKQH